MSDVIAKSAIRERISTEMKEFVVIAVYLFVCFTAVAFLKAAILHAHGIDFAPFGFATAKALIFAKFILLGRALSIGEQFKTYPLIWPTLHKSFAFLVLLMVLNVIEEVVVGLIHHRTILDSIADIGGGTIEQMIATSVIMLLILIPFFAFHTLGEIVGEDNLIQLFFLHHRKGRKGGVTANPAAR